MRLTPYAERWHLRKGISKLVLLGVTGPAAVCHVWIWRQHSARGRQQREADPPSCHSIGGVAAQRPAAAARAAMKFGHLLKGYQEAEESKDAVCIDYKVRGGPRIAAGGAGVAARLLQLMCGRPPVSPLRRSSRSC